MRAIDLEEIVSLLKRSLKASKPKIRLARGAWVVPIVSTSLTAFAKR